MPGKIISVPFEKEALKEFIYMTQNIYNRFNIKHYWNIYFPFMRLLHYVYVLRENRWRQKHLK